MNQRITDLFRDIDSALISDPEDTKTARDDLARLHSAVVRELATYEGAIRKQGASVPRASLDNLWEQPAGCDILRRAMAADPARTEADLRALGAYHIASVAGADHAAREHRGEFQTEIQYKTAVGA